MFVHYPYRIINKIIHGTKAKIIGVAHTTHFFETHEKFFKEKISSSETIMLEQPPVNEFYQSRDLRGKTFFQKIGELAYKKKNASISS